MVIPFDLLGEEGRGGEQCAYFVVVVVVVHISYTHCMYLLLRSFNSPVGCKNNKY